MEILAPAGGLESVFAAVRNGADAVYLGQQSFSARRNAQNFTAEELKIAVDFCHLHQVKVYQALNTIVFDDELPVLEQTMKLACELAVDAFIIQDFGVLKLAKQVCPQMPLHGSTQMSVHSVGGARLMEQLGLTRIVLAREMSLEQIAQVVEQSCLEVEVFAHGALCMSVSGQCYMSAAIGGRSGNKGNCAGTCRLPFGVANASAYDLSLKDLCAALFYQSLEQIGVTSLKIEGRMKRPEYVAAATRAYSQLKAGKTPDTERLKAVFSRSGFTDGYLAGKLGKDMFGIREKEDVLSATKDVLTQLQESYRREKPCYPVGMRFVLHPDTPLQLTMWDHDGSSVTVTGDLPQQAHSSPITEETVKESLAKLGGTPYFLIKTEMEIASGFMVRKSALNQLRRDAAAALNQKRSYRPPVPFIPSVQTVGDLSHKAARKSRPFVLRARFGTLEQIPFFLLESLQLFSLPVEQVIKHVSVLLPQKSRLILEPDRVLFGRESIILDQLAKLKEQGFSRLLASNPAHIEMGQALGFQIFGSQFLNITNHLSAEQYNLLGVSDTLLSTELTCRQLQSIRPDAVYSSLPLGAVIYGYLPLMIVKNCPVRRHMSCKSCQGKQFLIDRKGNRFPVICNQKRYSEILNCMPLYLADKLEDFSKLNFGTLYFTTEDRKQTAEIIKAYHNRSPFDGKFTRGLYYRGIV